MADKKLVIVGLGALGTRTAENLIRSGIKGMSLVDFDLVDEKNIGRQVLYQKKDIGLPKARALKARLLSIASDARIEIHEERLTEENAAELLSGIDVILDCTDNMEARRIINTFANQNGIAWVHAAVIKSQGTVIFFHGSPCLECVYPGKASLATCTSDGLSLPAASAVSELQASLAMKYLAGEKLSTELIRLDISQDGVEKHAISRRCDICRGD